MHCDWGLGIIQRKGVSHFHDYQNDQKGFPFLNRGCSRVRLTAKENRARWDVSQIYWAVLDTQKKSETCVNSWEKHPSLLCETDKNNTVKYPAEGYAQNGSVFPSREGHCQAGLDLQPTHIKGTLSYSSIFAPVFSCFDRKQEMITYSHKQAEIASDLLPRCPPVVVDVCFL